MRRLVLIIAFLILAGATTVAAEGESWHMVTAGRDGNSWVDLNSMRREGDCVVFLHRAMVNNNPRFRQLRIKTRICCSARTKVDLEIAAYDADVEEITRFKPAYRVEQIHSGTVGEDLLRFVCSRAR